MCLSAAKYCKTLFSDQNTAGDTTPKKRSKNGSKGANSETDDGLGTSKIVAHDAAEDEHELTGLNDKKDKVPEAKIPLAPTEKPAPSSVPGFSFFGKTPAVPKRRSSGSDGPSFSGSDGPSAFSFFVNPRAGKQRAKSEGNDQNSDIQIALDKVVSTSEVVCI